MENVGTFQTIWVGKAGSLKSVFSLPRDFSVRVLMHQRHKPTTKTKSAALLAAEAAFAPPRQTAERLFIKGSPAITVIRAKQAAAPADSTTSDLSAVSDATPSSELQFPAPKAPRVFLLKPVHVGFGSTPSETWPQREGHAEEAGAPFGLDRAAPGPVRRAKRSRNIPPPVTLVFCAVAAVAAAGGEAGNGPSGEIPASLTEAQDNPPSHSLASLAAALAAMEPTFAAISAAISFTVEDPEVTAQWERLSTELDQIALEIRASSAKASAA